MKIKWYEILAIQVLVMIWLYTEATPDDFYKITHDLSYFVWVIFNFFVVLTIPLSIILNALKHKENMR